MASIRVYGDSFGAKTSINLDCWADIIGRKLSLPVVNNGVSGGSTEYAIKLLATDICKGHIDDNDIIFFVASTPGRLHFNFQHNGRPETASRYLHGADSVSGPGDHSWYVKNKDHIEWWMVNQDNSINRLNHEAYLHLIENYARSRPTVKFFILSNSDHLFHIPTGEKPKNLFKPTIFLNYISNSELIGDNTDYQDWIRYTTIDFRVNHLTIPNLEILSNCLIESLESGSVDNITYDRFKSNFLSVIQNKEQYLKHVNNGLLYYSDNFLEFLG
jgi:hypothetical protein